jgi:hypothetical protein
MGAKLMLAYGREFLASLLSGVNFWLSTTSG